MDFLGILRVGILIRRQVSGSFFSKKTIIEPKSPLRERKKRKDI